MAFASTLVSKTQLPGGNVRETYTWSSDGGTATGNITADVTIQPEITKIDAFGASSDGDDAALVCARDAGARVLKLTFTANGSGTAFLEGPAA